MVYVCVRPISEGARSSHTGKSETVMIPLELAAMSGRLIVPHWHVYSVR